MLQADELWTDPYFYIPKDSLKPGLTMRSTSRHPAAKDVSVVDLDMPSNTGTKSLQDILYLEDDKKLGHVMKIPVGMISWFVEDEKLLGPHPKDPYKRVETIPSSREIRIEVKGQVIATSTNNVFLYETSLRPRYYLSPTAVNPDLLIASKTISYCPYKGEAK